MVVTLGSFCWSLFVEGTIDVCPLYYMADNRTPFIAHFSASSSSLTQSAASTNLRMSAPGGISFTNYYTWSTAGTPGWRNDSAPYATRQPIPISLTTASGWLIDMSTSATMFGVSSVCVRFRAPNNASNNLDVAPIGGATVALYIPITGLDSTTNGGWIEGRYSTANTIVLAKDSSGNILGSYITENNQVTEGYDSTSTGYFKLAVPVGQVASLEFRNINNVSLDTQIGPWTILVGKTTFANHKPSDAIPLSPAASVTLFQATSVNLVWSATDADNDPLSARIQISQGTGIPPLYDVIVAGTTANVPIAMGSHVWRILTYDSIDFAANWSAWRDVIVYDSTFQAVVTGIGTAGFYLGDTSDYTPVQLYINSMSAVDTVTITVFNEKHPNAARSGQYFISRWWQINHTGGIDSTDIKFWYTASDVTDANLGTLSEDSLQVAKYSGTGTSWDWYAPAGVPVSHTIQLNGITSFSDWSLSGPNGLPVELSRFETAIKPD
ncbi:MAG: hypothetical protein QME64_09000 [bacterium]|nr:hypothetical protein [bacterium]